MKTTPILCILAFAAMCLLKCSGNPDKVERLAPKDTVDTVKVDTASFITEHSEIK